MKSDIDLIHQLNVDALNKAIQTLETVTYETVSELIPRLLQEGKLNLDHSIYAPADPDVLDGRGIGRYMLYDHPDVDNPFSIWLFVLAPRQKTSIHDHLYRGTVTVLSEAVSEKYFEPSGEKTARLIGRSDRFRFHTNHDELNDGFVHQLKRRKALREGISCTLHIYEMPAYKVSMDGEKNDNRNLNRIYGKEKTPKSTRPSYRAEQAETEYEYFGP
ncbi:cupin domain-containing protein [Legionella taurinensis]|uniref:cysteine dioxygenase n=1 Tax=Legionella taurinensis TaxID=70611 RepID=UPI000E06FC42|nr:cysteine dioxygenase [Legionella taurinensis]MDX1837754.1 cysteine dioxygenase [Legionella taurinensis]STY26937.1 Predicted metal-dependent enzyme of the double-stranded beta helix superfamily [Legionella taurinensis]